MIKQEIKEQLLRQATATQSELAEAAARAQESGRGGRASDPRDRVLRDAGRGHL